MLCPLSKCGAGLTLDTEMLDESAGDESICELDNKGVCSKSHS